MGTTIERNNHGPNVKRWREWRKINQEVLGDEIGISQATLSLYEKRDKLEPEILKKIASALDIPIEAITEFVDETMLNIFSCTYSDVNNNAVIFNSYPTFNPIDKLVQQYEEKMDLYERMLKDKENTILILQEVLKERK